jgi:hypothetical protein
VEVAIYVVREEPKGILEVRCLREGPADIDPHEEREARLLCITGGTARCQQQQCNE